MNKCIDVRELFGPNREANSVAVFCFGDSRAFLESAGKLDPHLSYRVL